MLDEYHENQRVWKTNFVKKYRQDPLVYKYLMYPEFPPEPTKIHFGHHGTIQLTEEDVTDPNDIIQQIKLETGALHFDEYEVEDHITFAGKDFPIKQFIEGQYIAEVYATVDDKTKTFFFTHFGMGVWLPYKIDGWQPASLELYKTYFPDQTEMIDNILFY